MKGIKGPIFASLGMTLTFTVAGVIVGLLSLIPIMAQDSVERTTVGFIMLAVSVILISMGINSYFQTKRFLRYITLIVAHEMTSIEEIAANTKHQCVRRTKKDLQNMLSWGYFEGSVIDEETNEIIVNYEDDEDDSDEPPDWSKDFR